MSARKLLDDHLELVQKLMDFVGRRYRLHGEVGEEFHSYVMMRLLDNDCAVLDKFEGRSRLKTYLSTVVHRFALDFQDQRLGRWRPSTKAKRLGELALRLEMLISRDGFRTSEAVEMLSSYPEVMVSRDELHALAAQLPTRTRPTLTDTELDSLPSHNDAETLLLEKERAATSRHLTKTLQAAVASLPAADQLILELRFRDAVSVASISRMLNLDQRALYSRIDKLLSNLHDRLQDEGLVRDRVLDLIGQAGFHGNEEE